MRHIGRLLSGLLVAAVLVAAIQSGVIALRWLDGYRDTGVLDRRPDTPVALSSLNRYTKKAAGEASFRRYFTTMVVAGPDGMTHDPVVVKWEQPRVTVKLLDSDRPEVKKYLRRLVARLNRMQGEVRFAVGDRRPRITIRFVTHEQYVLRYGDASVGNTSTRYFVSSPGLISARITIDAGRNDDISQLKATLIHELTHAIGCSGHFTDPALRRRSVLYEASHVTSWSQDDAAVIRLLYSPWIESGMTAEEAQVALGRYARAAE